MKKFLATTATALVFSTGAYAAAHSSSFMDFEFESQSNIFASEMIGMRVYTTENETGETVAADGQTEWDDIGEVNNIVLTRDGDVAAVIVGVGGFLGIGERDVALDMSQIKFVAEEGDADDYFLVVNASRQMLEDAKPFSRHDDEMMETQAAAEVEATETETTGMASTDMATDRTMLVRPEIARDGYAPVDMVALTSENLTGARVYGINDEDVGEVSELLLTDDGKVSKVVLDVGGFLGIGEKRVAVTFDELQILRSEDGDDFRVYIDATQETLEAQPAYNS